MLGQGLDEDRRDGYCTHISSLLLVYSLKLVINAFQHHRHARSFLAEATYEEDAKLLEEMLIEEKAM